MTPGQIISQSGTRYGGNKISCGCSSKNVGSGTHLGHFKVKAGRFQGSGFRIWGLGFEVKGAGFEVQALSMHQV